MATGYYENTSTAGAADQWLIPEPPSAAEQQAQEAIEEARKHGLNDEDMARMLHEADKLLRAPEKKLAKRRRKPMLTKPKLHTFEPDMPDLPAGEMAALGEPLKLDLDEGVPINITFSDNGQQIGIFEYNRRLGIWQFSGDVDKSAQTFVDQVLSIFDGELKKAKYGEVDEDKARRIRQESLIALRGVIHGHTK